MRKSIFIIGLVFAVSVLHAEVLSWSVDLADDSVYTSAQLFTATSNSGYSGSGANVGDKVYKDSEAGYVVQYDSNVTSGTAFFYIRLFSGNNYVLYSDAMSWDALWTAGSLVSGSAPEFSSMTPWNIASTHAVPEPTSMALLAMGVSALLMRRKRRT